MFSYDPADDALLAHWSDEITDEQAAEAERRFLEAIARRDAEEAAEAELRDSAADLLF